MLFFTFENFLIILKCKEEIQKKIKNIDKLTIVKDNFFLLKGNIIKNQINLKDSNCNIFIFLTPEEMSEENKYIILNPIKKIIDNHPEGNINNNKFAKELLNQIQQYNPQIFFKKINLQ